MKALVVSIVVVLIDQLTKFSVKYSFEYAKPHKILGDVVRLTYIENPGMAFGIQFGNQKFFTAFTILATVVIFVYMVRARNEKAPLRFALALILGGAIGNVIDRLLYGKVVDFIDIGVGNTRWPIFNLADSAVTIGMLLLLAMLLFEKDSTENEKELAAESEAFS